MSVTNSPNMSLPVPGVGNENGPTYASDINSCMAIIDQHNHSSGSGVQITPSGLNINAALTLNNNFLTATAGITFQSQGSTPANKTAYVSSNDLYFTDGAGNVVQITSGGAVNATSSGISSGTATASFSGGVLVVNAASSTPANIQGGSVLLGNNTSGSKFLTLAPPAAMGANFTLTLPTQASIPVATSFMTMDSSGNMGVGAAVSGGLTTANLSASAGITRAQLVAPGQQDSGGHNASTNSSNYDAISGASVTITTHGNPIMIIINGAYSAFRATPGQSGFGVGLSLGGSLYRNNGFTLWYDPVGGAFFSNGNSYVFLDVQAAGTYTYGVMISSGTVAVTATASNAQIIAYEIK